MGWTSKSYRRWNSNKSESIFDEKDAEEFITEEFVYHGYSFAMVHFSKEYDEWVLYCLAKNSRGTTFIFVVLIQLKDNEIYWKTISEDEGPRPTKCPSEIFKFAPKATSDYAIDWRKSCLENNTKLNRIFHNV
jgi:hypothetical protein